MDSRLCSPTEFDIVRVTPHVDLVLFDNVISCYPSDRDITANYVLGQDVTQTNWDWVGIFRCEWRNLGEYTAYMWAQSESTDCTAPGRRAVVFPVSVHRLPDDARDRYQFLYVSRGNHVVGVSRPFRVHDELELPEFNIDTLFKITRPTTSVLRKERKGRFPSDDYGIVFDLFSPGPSKRPRRKEFVHKVFQDTKTLVDIPSFNNWAQKLRFIQFSPIVQEYDGTLGQHSCVDKPIPSTSGLTPASSALVPYSNRDLLPVYCVKWSNNLASGPLMIAGSPAAPSIEYPTPKSLTAGPISFLETSVNSKCNSCQFTRSLVSGLMEREGRLEEENRKLKMRLTRSRVARNAASNQQRNATTLVDWALSQVLDDNRKLRQRIDVLEEQLSAAREVKAEVKRFETAEDTSDNVNAWIIKEPKRVARLKRLVNRQSRSVQLLRQTTDAHRMRAAKLTVENIRLRALVSGAFETSDRFRELVEGLNERLQSVLAARAENRANEWRLFIREASQESTTQTLTESSSAGTCTENANETGSTSTSSTSSKSSISSGKSNGKKSQEAARPKTPNSAQNAPQAVVKNKQISKLKKSERPARSRLHRRRSEAEQCPTCGLHFSSKADRHVIEEHLVFHKRAASNNQRNNM